MEEKVMEKQAYQQWQALEAVLKPQDRVGDYQKYVIKAYLYIRSRLFVPGRHYENDEHGPLAAGGNAHADIMDLDIWLQTLSSDDVRDVLDWMRDSSLEDSAYWRGLKSRSTIKRRRTRIVENYASTQQTTLSTPR